jgi:outer membrane lipoprotein-sorting protein
LNVCIARCLLIGSLAVTIAVPAQAQNRAQDQAQNQVQNNDIAKLARAVDEHYNHLRSLESDFTEIYRGDGPERVESGTLWLKKPRKMRWEYRSPKEKLFVSDGQITSGLLAR